jgi:hypothetical protein
LIYAGEINPDMASFFASLSGTVNQIGGIALPDATTRHNRQYQQRNYRPRCGLSRAADQPAAEALLQVSEARLLGRPICELESPDLPWRSTLDQAGARVAPSCGGV